MKKKKDPDPEENKKIKPEINTSSLAPDPGFIGRNKQFISFYSLGRTIQVYSSHHLVIFYSPLSSSSSPTIPQSHPPPPPPPPPPYSPFYQLFIQDQSFLLSSKMFPLRPGGGGHIFLLISTPLGKILNTLQSHWW